MDLRMVVIPPKTEHTHTVVFLHGRGDTAIIFADMIQGAVTSRLRSLPDTFPSFRWVFPQSESRPVASSPPERWSQWFDVWNTRDFSDREGIQAEGLRESVASMRRIAKGEAELLGGRWDRVILAGFDQGGSTVVHTLLNLNIVNVVPGAPALAPGSKRLGGLMVFSSRMPFPGGTVAETREVLSLEDVPESDEVVRNTPILLEHSIDDPLALVGWGRNLRDQLQTYSAKVTWKEYPDGGHWFNSPSGMDDAVVFLSQALGPGLSVDG
ncbi:acyl-protein thioesterase [Plectosphaerella cucumerina]|jgi:predicted esterase|uniref:Acyl-protein thioesterase n=1 Tax=Plectosphaerella cucumerina TaxID=40658 RepID=A0A8K0TF64_9PEZI|nr:acyl-protein thioesterase [Plectosphaerella cucumerina]